MSIILGGVTLNPNLLWVDRDNYSPVVQERARTVAGSQVLWTQAATDGRPITLAATADQGWFTKAQKDAVMALGQTVGSIHVLTIGLLTFSVMFYHDDGDAMTFVPLIPRAVDLEGDYFTGQLRLFTVTV